MTSAVARREPAGPATGARGRRVVVAGLADQVLVAVTSAGTGLLGAALLSRAEAGVMMYSLAFLFFIQGVGRAFVGDTMLAHVSRFDDRAVRRRQFANAHATAASLGVLAALVLLGIWFAAMAARSTSVADLVWGVPFVPSILMQDACRYTYQTRRQQPRALVIDSCWVLVQAGAVALLVVTGHATGGALIAAWGLGATAGAAVFYLRTRINPFGGRPLAWLRDTRHLLGWFTAIGIIGQVTTLSVGTLVTGILTKTAYSGLRVVQNLVLQPAQSFVMALNGLVVPRASRLARDGDRAGLSRLTRNLVLTTGGLGLVGLAIAVPLAHPVLSWFRGGDYADIAVLAVPVGIQAVIYLLQVPFTMALRGMHRARMLFAQYLVFSVTQLTGLVLGAWRFGLVGAGWGLMTGAAVGLVVQASLYLVAIRGPLGGSGAGPAGPAELVDEPVT